MTGAETFAAARAKADAAKAALEAAQIEMNAAAQVYAKEAVLAYSAAHPRRLITFCAAMGYTNLHVSRSPNQHEFDFSERDECRDYYGNVIPHPQFMADIHAAADEHEFSGLGSNLLFKAKGGQVITDKEDW